MGGRNRGEREAGAGLLNAIDMFCGAGGLTRGALNAGIKVIAGFDVDERVATSYRRNNRGVAFFQSDIRATKPSDILSVAGAISNDELILMGCAPCQSFSTLIRDKHRRHDATLLGRFGRLIEAVRPAVVIMENVPGIARVPGYSTYRRFLSMLDGADYRYDVGILNAKEYGVAQNRKRLVLIGSRIFTPLIPKPTHGDGLREYETVRSTISDYPSLSAGEIHPDVPNHVSSSLSELSLRRIRATTHDGGGWKSWPRELMLDCHIRSPNGHSDVYGRLRWDTPGPTLTSRCTSISNGRYAHPEQDRGISLREAAALQSFPDDYVFYGTYSHIAKQIGNAVPVKLAEAVCKQVMMLAGSEPLTPAPRPGTPARLLAGSGLLR